MSFKSLFQWAIVKTLLNGEFMRVLTLVLFLFSSISFAGTYGDDASRKLVEVYQKLASDLSSFDENSDPVSVKQLRKDIGKFKIYLDVFMYAFPKTKDLDQLLILRGDVDLGYEVVGKFKDLNDSFDPEELTPELIKERRDLALNWKNEFLVDKKIKSNLAYLSQPLTGEVQKREETDLPKFFWREIKFPKKLISNSTNVLKFLLNNMIVKSANHLDTIKEFKNLFSDKRENKFHDFRKLLRAHLKLSNEFFKGEVGLGGSKESEYQFFTLLVDEFGDINDLLVKLHHNDKKKLKKKIQKKWKLIKAKIEDEQINERLQLFMF